MKRTIAMIVLAFALAITPAYGWFGPSRKEREAKAEAARVEAEARLAEAQAAIELAKAQARSNRASGDEATKAERGLGTELTVEFGPDGSVTYAHVATSANSNADLTRLSAVEIKTNQPVAFEANGKLTIIPTALTISLQGVDGSNLSAPATANTGIVTADAAGRAANTAAAGEAIAKILAEGYRGRAIVIDAEGKAQVALTEARFNGYVRIWNAATGFADVLAKRLTFTGAAGDVLDRVVGETADGTVVEGNLAVTPTTTNVATP